MGEEGISDVTDAFGAFLADHVFTRYGFTGCSQGLRYS